MLNSVYFLPHGMQIIPGVDTTDNEKFQVLHKMMEEITRKMLSEENDTVFILTPHGYNLERSFVVYNHDLYQGFTYELEDSVVFGEILERFEFKGNSKKSIGLAEAMKMKGIPTELLIHGITAYPLTLNWGTVVPLYYLPRERDIDYIIMCVPRARHESLNSILDNLKDLAAILSKQEDSYSIVVSGDLSHVHQEDGPYGYHESCKPFDELVMRWMENIDEKQMNELLNLQPTALACGMAGLYFLQHFLNIQEFELDRSEYELPTYFGMGIGRWVQP